MANSDPRPENLDCDVSALAQGVHDFIWIVTIKEDTLTATLSVNHNLSAMIAQRITSTLRRYSR